MVPVGLLATGDMQPNMFIMWVQCLCQQVFKAMSGENIETYKELLLVLQMCIHLKLNSEGLLGIQQYVWVVSNDAVTFI